VPLGLFLQRATPRETIARLLRNLKEVHRSAGDWPRMVAVQHRLVILLPEAWEERRDRALALAELGRPDLASVDLAQYLDRVPGAADGPPMRALLDAWRSQPGVRLQ
jgi:regulator of sirC expression with transglutaminase-like and TPR domain